MRGRKYKEREWNDPAKIEIRDKALAILKKYMRADEAIKIQYASKYAGIANAWKKWQGEVLGLKETKAVNKKLKYEQAFLARVNKNAATKEKYGNVLKDLNKAYTNIKSFALARDYYLETCSKIDLFNAISKVRALNAKKDRPDYNEVLAADIVWAKEFYKDFNEKVDKDLFAAMMEIYLQKQDPAYVSAYAKNAHAKFNNYKAWADDVYSKTIFANKEKVQHLLNTNPNELFNYLHTDEAAKLLLAIAGYYDEDVAPKLNKMQLEINRLQRIYMKGQMEVFKEKNFYPDANSTLRVAFGNVSGFTSPGGKKYEYYTYLDGVIEKYKPGDYEFDVPKKLLELHKAKDYGQYADNGKMPVCFIASNHTTGGNSGSPAIDANGYLVGLNFDRAWEGTMSDINYDARICRNIMVDIRYVLFIIDKFAGADHLVKEMKLVYPE